LLVVALDDARVGTAKENEILIPLAQDICVKVDLVARRIEAILPEGLLDVNAK
jgi:ribosomal 30S subunit maturation factor RimM